MLYVYALKFFKCLYLNYHLPQSIHIILEYLGRKNKSKSVTYILWFSDFLITGRLFDGEISYVEY